MIFLLKCDSFALCEPPRRKRKAVFYFQIILNRTTVSSLRDLRSPTGRVKDKIPAGIYVVPEKGLLLCEKRSIVLP